MKLIIRKNKKKIHMSSRILIFCL